MELEHEITDEYEKNKEAKGKFVQPTQEDLEPTYTEPEPIAQPTVPQPIPQPSLKIAPLKTKPSRDLSIKIPEPSPEQKNKIGTYALIIFVTIIVMSILFYLYMIFMSAEIVYFQDLLPEKKVYSSTDISICKEAASEMLKEKGILGGAEQSTIDACAEACSPIDLNCIAVRDYEDLEQKLSEYA